MCCWVFFPFYTLFKLNHKFTTARNIRCISSIYIILVALHLSFDISQSVVTNGYIPSWIKMGNERPSLNHLKTVFCSIFCFTSLWNLGCSLEEKLKWSVLILESKILPLNKCTAHLFYTFFSSTTIFCFYNCEYYWFLFELCHCCCCLPTRSSICWLFF